MKHDYYEYSKLNGGVGGWHCACCNMYRCSARKMKRLARRLVRRKNKQTKYDQEL